MSKQRDRLVVPEAWASGSDLPSRCRQSGGAGGIVESDADSSRPEAVREFAGHNWLKAKGLRRDHCEPPARYDLEAAK